MRKIKLFDEDEQEQSNMNGKARLDYLVNSESQRQAIYGGCCYKFVAVISSLMGIAVLISSFFVLNNERLQIQNYLEPQPRFYYEIFPSLYLGCAAATTASSIVQTIGALMLIFEDITLNVWKWLNFTILMISSATLMLLSSDKNQYEITSFSAYFVIIILNSIFSMLHLSCDMCLIRARKKNEPQPY